MILMSFLKRFVKYKQKHLEVHLMHAYGCDLNYIGHSILQNTDRYMCIFMLIVGACDRCHVYESLNFP